MAAQIHFGNTQESSTKLQATHENQYLTFILANEEYGVDILSVVEIRGLEKTTAIPAARSFIKGVINLRGTIIPVMDLRERFNMPSATYGRSTVLVVLQVNHHELKKEIGVIVDAVSDVYKISSQDIKAKPDFCNSPGQEYIQGLITVSQENKSDKLVILLDANKLLELDELHDFSNSEK